MAFSPTTTILTTRSSQSVAGDAAVADHGIGRVVDALRRLKSRSWRTVMENLAARDASKHLAKRHMRSGAIAGTVVGVVIAIGLLVLCLYPVVVHQLKRRRNAAHPTFDAEAAMAAEADSSAAAASGSHRRLSSSDSLKQSGNLTRGQNGVERESKELEWNASRDNEALSGSRAVFGHPDSFSMDGATDETYDYAATNSFRPQPAPFLPLQCYDGEFAPPVADDDQPGVLKGTSADYYSPSIPSEAFGMITQPTMAANPPVHSPSRGSSLRYNVKQMFRRKSGRDRTLSSTTSPTEHTGSMPSAAVPHLEGATPMQHIITDGHHVESPTNVSPTSMTMPDFPASQASQAPMSPPSSSPDAMVKTPPLSPFSERQARKAPSPPMYAAPGTVNPMDIMPASTESEVWHRTEHQLYTSTNETTKPQPNDYDSTMPSPSPTPPDSQDLATELLAQPFTATDQGFTYTTDPAEPTYAVDSVMPDVPDYHHLHPTASPEGRHPSYPSEHSTPYPGHAFTDVSSQNTPSTQIDSPSPQSLGSSDFRHSVSPQPVLSVPSPKNGVFHCDEPGCQQVFDQPHKLKHHQRYHSKDHKCPYAGCGKGFGTKTHLQRHINDRHEKKKKFHCSVAGCDYSRAGGKAFPRKDNWKRHMTKIHNMDQQQLPEPVEVDLDMSGT